VSEAVDANPPSITGRTAIIERANLEVAPFPDRRGEVRVLLLNGDRVASVALCTATNSGPLPPAPEGKPAPPTNKSIGMLIAHTIELDPTGAHAVREATYVDEGTMMAQLGLSPAPARKAEKATGAPAQGVIAKNDDRERANIDVVRRTFAALNAHDAKGVAETMAPNYKAIEIGLPKDNDRNAALASLKEMFSGFPDVRITPVTMWAAGDYVVVTGTFEGTNLGNLPSMGVK
jgi:predicted ester cyclase